jgi:hypothetical protein
MIYYNAAVAKAMPEVLEIVQALPIPIGYSLSHANILFIG